MSEHTENLKAENVGLPWSKKGTLIYPESKSRERGPPVEVPWASRHAPNLCF